MKYIKNILFDLGGVILTLDHEEAIRRFEEKGVVRAKEILDPYQQQGAFRLFEEGKIGKETFYTEMNKLSVRPISDKDIDWCVLGFVKEIPDYKLDMLETLRKKHKIYLLSNTNPIVMKSLESPSLGKGKKSFENYFDKMYLSFELHCTKPDRPIFDLFLKDSGTVPEETLFIDDGAANITTARKLGFLTYQPENGEDFRQILEYPENLFKNQK